MHVRKDRLRVIEVGLHADIFARFILYDSCFRRFQRKMGLKRPMGILQNQTSGLLQLILYKRHGKVVGDTLFFERLTQGVTEEAHALGYDFSVRYFYGSQPTDEQICAIQSEPCEALLRFGYRIPQDVSVIGFDDSSISTTRTPPLTTMQVQKQRLGALAVDRLHTRLQKDVPARSARARGACA